MQASEVAGLFRSIVDEIRGAKHEGLDAMAKEWLTTASRGLLLQLEAELLSVRSSPPARTRSQLTINFRRS